VEPKSRLPLITHLPNKDAERGKRAIIDFRSPLAAKLHTLTSDMKKEFAADQSIVKAWQSTSMWYILMLDSSQGSTKILMS
jgi:IS30 family transposase